MNDHFMGLNGFIWFTGIIENRQDPLNTGRAQVRIHGRHTDNKSFLPTQNLPWAHPVLPLNSKIVLPPPEGTMVMGFFLDGDSGQFPMIMGSIPGIPDTPPDTSKGFSDPRTDNQLQSAPRPPSSVDYPTTGAGVTINEASQAQRFPVVLNEPTTSRIARNENIQDTIIARKNQTLVSTVPVATGGVTIDAGVDITAMLDERALLAAILPRSITNFLNKYGNIEICGLSINALLPSGVLVGGINIQTPEFIGGEIFVAGLTLLEILANGITLSDFIPLQVDIFGCIIGLGPIGGYLHLDGGLRVPLLAEFSAAVNLIPGLTIGATVHGGVSLGTMGGIPLSTSAFWSEPPSPYNAQYPYNNVHESESGHVIEIDDTPGHERLHTFHRSGTFEEIGPDGSRVTKIVRNNYQITMSDDNVYVMGDCNVTVNGNRNEHTTTDKQVNVDGKHVELIKGDSNETILGAQTTTIAKGRTTTITQNDDHVVQGSASLGINQNYNVVVLGDRNVIVKGTSTVAVQGQCNLMVSGDCVTSVGGNMNATVLGSTNLTVTGDSTSTVTGQQIFNATGFTFNIVGAGNFEIDSLTGGNFIMTSPLGTFATQTLHTFMTPIPNQ